MIALVRFSLHGSASVAVIFACTAHRSAFSRRSLEVDLTLFGRCFEDEVTRYSSTLIDNCDRSVTYVYKTSALRHCNIILNGVKSFHSHIAVIR